MTMTVKLRRVLSMAALAAGASLLAVSCEPATTPTVESTGEVTLESSDGGGETTTPGAESSGEAETTEEAATEWDDVQGTAADEQTRKDVEAVVEAVKEEAKNHPSVPEVTIHMDADDNWDGFSLEDGDKVEVNTHPGTMIIVSALNDGSWEVVGYNADGSEYVDVSTFYTVSW